MLDILNIHETDCLPVVALWGNELGFLGNCTPVKTATENISPFIFANHLLVLSTMIREPVQGLLLYIHISAMC